MWHIPSNPQDQLKSQLEYENFLSEQAEKKNFLNGINRIADGANKKSTFATITSILALLIALASLVIQLLDFLF